VFASFVKNLLYILPNESNILVFEIVVIERSIISKMKTVIHLYLLLKDTEVVKYPPAAQDFGGLAHENN